MKRRGAIQLVALLPLIPLIVAIINLISSGHFAPRLHAARMARYNAGQPVLFQRTLERSHNRMMQYQGIRPIESPKVVPQKKAELPPQAPALMDAAPSRLASLPAQAPVEQAPALSAMSQE